MNEPGSSVGEVTHPILQSWQASIDQLAKEALNFVAAVMASKHLISPALAHPISRMVFARNGISIEPIHPAPGTAVALRGMNDATAMSMRNEKPALIHVCGSSQAAGKALPFLLDLPSLLHQRACAREAGAGMREPRTSET